ncbi:MAG: lysozyme inhibitor LprI family protein [Pseudomonadota bacterium]
MKWSVLLLLAAPVMAEDLVFDIDATTACLAAQESEHAKLLCVGRAAAACMDMTEGGTTTVGMGGCLAAEWAWWDAELNTAYQALLAEAGEIEADAEEFGLRTPPMVAPIREMQRAWIGYRDGLCAFERAKWGGGTGGGPASAACMMQETARQTLVLQRGTGLE